MSAKARSVLVVMLVSSTLAAGVSRGAAATPPPPHPGTSWQTVGPAKVGLDAKALNRIAETAKQGKSNCLVVVRDGSGVS